MVKRKKGEIQINLRNKGKLHKTLGIPANREIPVEQLEAAAESKNRQTRRRAQFALNARKWNGPAGSAHRHHAPAKTRAANKRVAARDRKMSNLVSKYGPSVVAGVRHK